MTDPPRASPRGSRAAAALAWTVWAVTISLFGGALTGVTAGGLPDRPGPLELISLALPIFAFPTVGAIVASRRPANPMGWIFCAIGLFLMAGIATNEYVLYAIHLDAPLPAVTLAGWVSAWTWFVAMGLAATLMLLLFPNGRPPSPRWRVVAWLAVLLTIVMVLAFAIRPGPLDSAGKFINPFGVGGPIGDVAAAVTQYFSWPLFGLAVVSFAGLVTRSVRARGDERQQLKWVAYAAAIMAFGTAATITVNVTGAATHPVFSWIWFVPFLGLGLVPVAAGIAILRHRLFDIDLLINRTLVYGGLTVTLVAVYVGSVILLQGLLSGLTGGNSLAVAASTLGVAALFGPIRRRLQTAVDRRFYRSKYDGARTVEAFATRLRDEVDLAHLTGELSDVVAETLRPASVSVWLRSPGGGR